VFIRRLKEQKEILAGDGCHLRELLNARTDHRAYRYSFAHAVVKPGERTRPHALKTSEVYYVLEGHARMHIGDESAEIFPGDAIDIPPGAVQWVENSGKEDLVFICIVDPGWRVEDEVVLA